MKSKKEIEKLAEKWCTNVSSSEKLAYKDGYTQCQEDTEKLICKSCGFVITTNDINKHLFMKVKGGGLIHWDCDDCDKLNKQE